MIQCFLTDAEGKTHQIPEPQPGCWVNVVSPTADEQALLHDQLGIVPEFLRSSLDDEESSHVDFDDDTRQTLVIIDCPFVEDEREAEDPTMTQYDTHPLSVLIVPEHDIIITFSLRENPTVRDFTERYIFHMDTHQRTRLLLGIFLRVAQRYLVYLRNINRQFIKNEKALQKSLANEDLIKMLGLEKSLVYFSTSLKADEATLVRINSGRSLKLYEDDKDLLEDVFIEIRQAIEMCTIYSNILNGTMDTYGNVIANNMNIVMRTLTVVAIVLALPTIVFSFYGMNVEQLPLIMSPIFPLVLSIVAVALAIFAMQRMKPFK